VRTWQSSSPEETLEVGRSLAAELAPAGILLLEGDLAAGKTVLAQGVALGLGIDPREVQSPTFTLVREHQGPSGRLIHIDLYRLDPEELEGLGLEEILAGPGVKVVEWPERLPRPWPVALWLRLEIAGPRQRRIEEVVT
jgi:tRNA threonylcarbamoyladenosine biosynthesis protein TsaE